MWRSSWAALVACSLTACAIAPGPVSMSSSGSPPLVLQRGQHAQVIDGAGPGGAPIRFWLYAPDAAVGNAAPDAATKVPADALRWPLLIFLHGSGERGDDLARVKVHGPPKRADVRGDLPFIIASPQLPQDRAWNADWVMPLLDKLLRELPIDPDRVYLTGLSLGGFGTWDVAAAHAGRFAAIAPVCGWGEVAQACALRNLPVWAFHGADDTVVAPEAGRAMVDAVVACGGKARFTLYPGVGHDAWNPAYADPALYDWLLQQRRPAP